MSIETVTHFSKTKETKALPPTPEYAIIMQ